MRCAAMTAAALMPLELTVATGVEGAAEAAAERPPQELAAAAGEEIATVATIDSSVRLGVGENSGEEDGSGDGDTEGCMVAAQSGLSIAEAEAGAAQKDEGGEKNGTPAALHPWLLLRQRWCEGPCVCAAAGAARGVRKATGAAESCTALACDTSSRPMRSNSTSGSASTTRAD